MNKWKSVIGVVSLTLALSCSDDRIYENFYSFETHSWSDADTATFDLSQVTDAGRQRLIAIKYSEEYPFSNCYIRVISRDSIGTVLDNTLLNTPLFESKSGQPMGKGFGNSFTKYDTLPFEIPEHTKQVQFIQYMRQEHLPGIEAVGLKIVK
jgi:gliding motility-associated lipoprotein GldH